MNEFTKKNQLTLFLGSIVLTNIAAIIYWFAMNESTFFQFNDRLFITAGVIASLGFIAAITAKSRRHYYVHVRKKFSGKALDDTDFDKEEVERERHTKIGILIGVAGVICAIESAIFVFI